MIALFTDFGLNGPYVGQMKAALLRDAGWIPVVDLMHDAPAFNARAASYLLAALVRDFPAGTVFLCVVDPGVGTASRLPVAVLADGYWFVGPNNGLFHAIARHSLSAKATAISWRPERLSDSFHGRDLFAPVAARIARGEPPPGTPLATESLIVSDWPSDLGEVIYIDCFGNVMTGLRYEALAGHGRFLVLPELHTLEYRQILADDTTRSASMGPLIAEARTFGDVPVGQCFWYKNAHGLVEIAVNQGNAASVLTLDIGVQVRFT